MEESDVVKKLVHRKIKDITISSEFRNFVFTLIFIGIIVYFFSSKPAYYTEYEKREKIDIKKLFTACLDAVEKGGKEVRVGRNKKQIIHGLSSSLEQGIN